MSKLPDEGTRLTNLENAVEQLQGLHDEIMSVAAKGLVAENEQLKARVADGWQRRQDAWTRTANLARENRDLKAKNEQLEAEWDAAQRECVNLEAHIGQLTAENERRQNRVAGTWRRIDELVRERDSLARENEQLKARVAELERLRDTPIPSPGAVKWCKYRELVVEVGEERPDWRNGQVAYSAAYEVDPEWTTTIHNTARDPYFDDSRIPAFEAELRAGWNVPEGELHTEEQK